MPDSIADDAVVLSLMLEALRLLDGPEHDRAAAHLRCAIDALSPKRPLSPSQFVGMKDPGEPRGVALP